ncbi:unnamed protein product, partial [Laminaria digitata]
MSGPVQHRFCLLFRYRETCWFEDSHDDCHRYREACCFEDSHDAVMILASPSADFETMPASSAYSMPHTALRTHAFQRLLVSDYPIVFEVNQIPYDTFDFAGACQHDVYRSSLASVSPFVSYIVCVNHFLEYVASFT